MEQLFLSLPYHTSYAPADFVISDCNRIAYEKIRQKYVPSTHILGIIGDIGTGKTHLTSVFHSVNPTASLITPQVLKQKDLFAIPAHSFIIDDADMIKDETGFFHIINIARERKGMVLYTAKTAPNFWKIRLPDLKSRLSSSELIFLKPIDTILHFNILEKLFSDRQIMVNPDIIDYILNSIKPDVQSLKKFVEYFDNTLLRYRRSPSKKLAKEVFSEYPAMLNKE